MRNTLLCLFFTLICFSSQASRKEILLNENWMFRFWHQVQHKSEERVNLPHTWNATDALSGKQDYFRGLGNYTKKINILPEWEGKRLYLRFDGAHTITNLFINQTHVGEHRGGIMDRINHLMNVKGKESVDSIHRKLGHIMWEYIGMARDAEGLNKAIAILKDLKK